MNPANPDWAGCGTDQREEAEPGGPGVTLKDSLEFVEEGPLFRASLPFKHCVILSPPFILRLIMVIVHLILEWRDSGDDNKYK